MTNAALPVGFGAIRDTVELLSPLGGSWWVTGGWAIDLFVGRVTRTHNGVDLFMLDRDRRVIEPLIAHGDQSGQAAAATRLPATERPGGTGPSWCVLDAPEIALRTQVAFCTPAGEDLIFASKPTVRRQHSDATAMRFGVPIINPAVVLCLRAFSFRVQDDEDFVAAFPLLDPADRVWLAHEIRVRAPSSSAEPGRRTHPWLDRLEVP